VAELAQNENPHASLNLPNGLMVKRSYDHMVFKIGVAHESREFLYLMDGAGTYYIAEVERTICLTEREPSVDQNKERDEKTAYLDAEKLQFPLIIRNFRPGDRFVPLGMTGHKKIKDFFIDLKVPVEARTSIPLLVSDDKPVWICGYRIDERYKVTSKTRRVLEASIC
jgi:tRNA(Ile)-lysidine synthase